EALDRGHEVTAIVRNAAKITEENVKVLEKDVFSLTSNDLQAFCMSSAARIGIGNLAGVALAISMGGPGAVFWMWVIAIIGA
ncbi:alanine:cation symporter family protein, partial [Bacillus tropicus]|uniref:alanine:cation symporter family protein n=1 Tax=Bacillus tropicus TaxID=2026188 RepID=UPI002405CC93